MHNYSNQSQYQFFLHKFSLKWTFYNNNHQMKVSKNKRTKFEEQFEDSEANYSDVYQPHVDSRENTGRPIQLIRIKQDGKIEVNEDALNIIAQYNIPIGFVSLVGKMRTGKSCLLNRLLQLTGKGFQVDPSVSSCTQGIWMWSEPLFSPAQNNYVFVLDTEGTDSLEKDTQNDTKIFTLSLLISSYFIYNSVGSIDQRSLSELQMVTALSKTIKTDNKITDKDNQQALHRFMPKFLWILRDFTLKIEDERGRRISATQYLQNCLSEQSGVKTNDDTRKVKKSILTYFKDRQCVTLVRPIGDEVELQRLNNIPDHALRKEFIDGVNNIRELVLRNAGPKTYEGEIITGPAITSMIESYVQAFNSNKVPNIKSAWQQIAEDQGSAAYNRALEKYQEIFKEQFPDDTPKGEQIYKTLARLRDETVKQFEANSYGNINQDYLKKLKDLIKKKEQSIIEINKNVNDVRNNQILKKHAQKIRTKLESGKYNKKKEELTSDIQQLARNYNAEARGENKGQILTQFITDLTQAMLSLDAPDTSEAEEQRQRQKIKAEQLQKKLKIQNDQIESMKRQLDAKKDAEKVNINNATKNDKGRDKDKQKKSSGGCCSGDKCQIM